MNELIAANRVVLGKYNAKTESWTINYWVKATGAKKPKTVWWETRYDAGTHGTSLVNTFLGSRRAFSFPKSVYAVADCLAMVVRDRPNAKILDFFAGSGTTLHSTLLLNQQYGGSRQCVLVTNNELNYKAVAKLNKADRFRGDLEYEAQGVFESATRPRVKAALSGKKPNGEDVKGKYLDGRKFAEGFAENVEFFELDYLDGAEVEFGLRFAEIEPLLWLRAGGIGPRPTIDLKAAYAAPAGSPYAVLFGPSGLPGLIAALAERTDLTHVFIVADSEATFAQLADELPDRLNVVWLFHDYLDAVRSATR
jgi:adenine-specific DNA-methyltransferase